MKQRILVLGAGGFIGQRVVKALSATDWATPVAAFHRLPSAPSNAEQLALDATKEPALRQVLRDVGGVVNCVAGDAQTISASAQALFSAASGQPQPPRVVHLSTMSVYGSATGDVDETAELKGDLGPYSSAKVEAEQLAATYASSVILRPSCVYGPGSSQWSERIALFLTAHRVGDLGAAGDGHCNLVYIDDLVEAVLLAQRAPGIQGPFNVSIPDPPTWNEYFLRFARALRAVPVSRISRRRLALETKLFAAPLKMAELLQKRVGIGPARLPPPIPPSLARLWRQDIRLKSDKARSALGLKSTSLEQGLLATAAWLKRS